MIRLKRAILPLFGIASIGNLLYYRPLPNHDGDKGGPRRQGPWISKHTLSDFADQPLPIIYDICRHFIIFITVNVSRLFLYGTGKFKIKFNEKYYNFVNKVRHRDPGVPLITVSNHRSVYDDPPLFGALLPYWMNIQPKFNRYNMCSQEYCFNSKVMSTFGL